MTLIWRSSDITCISITNIFIIVWKNYKYHFWRQNEKSYTLWIRLTYWLNEYWACICKPFKVPWNRFSAWSAGTVRQSSLSYRLAMLHRQVESNPRNRFLVSLNVYKYGLWYYCLYWLITMTCVACRPGSGCGWGLLPASTARGPGDLSWSDRTSVKGSMTRVVCYISTTLSSALAVNRYCTCFGFFLYRVLI